MWLEEALVGRHPLGGRRRDPGRGRAHAGDRVPHDGAAGVVGRGDLRLAQPARGQRHQVLLARRDEALRRARGRDRGAAGRAVRAGAEPGRRDARTASGANATWSTWWPRRTARSTGMSVVVDCANGAASEVAPRPASSAGRRRARDLRPTPTATTSTSGAARCTRRSSPPRSSGWAPTPVWRTTATPTGRCSPTRAGNVIDGDQVLAACAIAMHERGTLAGDLVVTTVMANLGFHRAMREAGIDVVATQVGDRYVLEEMLRQRRRAGRGAVGPRDLPRAGHHRRRAAHRGAVPLAGRVDGA